MAQQCAVRGGTAQDGAEIQAALNAETTLLARSLDGGR
jgi:hypothetical protein